MMVWIDPELKIELRSGESDTFILAELSTMLAGLKMVKIYLPDQPDGFFYTVELRRQVSYNTNVPNKGIIIIHKYEEGRNRS